ncbi:MAG: DNA-deoxyinosine glycosylase [Pseudomonadales bacterium]|nr:DNA-deoxyinosine glycosylase [Pseudomonadales bacterium]
MKTISGFAPTSVVGARVLILGSMPGIASLERRQYYGHPRNVFWRIMAELFDFDVNISYKNRLEKMDAEGIALWDVLKTCQRPSSLDADIVASSVMPNDFSEFLVQRSSMRKIYFNGAKAEALFTRHVSRNFVSQLADVQLHRLPSTSPAYASMGYAQKLSCWRAIVA